MPFIVDPVTGEPVEIGENPTAPSPVSGMGPTQGGSDGTAAPAPDPNAGPVGATQVDDPKTQPSDGYINPFDGSNNPVVATDPPSQNPSVPSDGVGPIGPNAGFTPEGTIAPPPNYGDIPQAGFIQGVNGRAGGGRAGQIDLDTGGQFQATTREVQDNELVAHQLSNLLDSDSRYIQQNRLQGLAQSNARGGLGGTSGVGAAVSAAIRAGLPIATADAQAYRDAATQNMNALNQFGLANMQRVTQLALGNLDAATRVQVTSMNNANQMAIAQLNSMTSIELANLDANTRFALQHGQQQFQERLADIQFMQTQVLNRQQQGYQMEQLALGEEYRLINTQMQGEYQLDNTYMQGQIQRELNYTNAVMGAYNTYMQGLSSLNGIEMDDAARQRAEASIYNSYVAQIDIVNLLYPEVPPINLQPPAGG